MDAKAAFLHLYLTKLNLGMKDIPADSPIKKSMLKVIESKYSEYASIDSITKLNEKKISTTDPATYLNAVLVAKLLKNDFTTPTFFQTPSGALFDNFDMPVNDY